MKPANDNRKRLPNNGWWMIPVFWFGFLMALAYAVYQVYAAEPIVGRASVIDGDTIEIHGQRIRLWGIDAPEGKQRCVLEGKIWRCGTDSANALADHLQAQTVSCTEKDRDRYKRIVAVCEVAGEDVGAWLVRSGWALDYVKYSHEAYASEQVEAKRDKRGLWQGEFEPPWVWRRSQ